MKTNTTNTRKFRLALTTLVLLAAMLVLAAGSVWAQCTPHPLYVNVQNESGISPATGDLTFEAWLTKDPASVLTESSAGCFYTVFPGCGVECGNFGTAWTAGDVVHIEVKQTSTGDVGSGEFTLTNDNYQMFAGAAGIIIAPPPPPSEVWVDDDYTEGSCGGHTWGYDAFATIQEGIDAVSGSTVNVADGIYTITSKILVDEEVTITGNISNPENVVVQYSPAADSLMFDIRANNVTIEGIKTTGGKSGFWFDQSAVTGCTISHCIVDSVGAYGIYMKNGGSGHTIEYTTIQNTGQTYAGAPAVLVENCLNVTINGNTFSSISDKGIFVTVCNATNAAERVKVTGNILSGCAYPCIQVYQSPYTYVYSNTISSTSDKGINIIGPNASSQAARVIVEGNNISGCPWEGILVTHDRYTYIYNNTITSTGDKGITVGNGENVTSSAERIIVEGNNVSGTKYPGIQVAWGIDYTYIHDNTLSGCNYYGADGSGDWDYASIHVAENCENTVVDSNDVSDGINGIQIWADNCTVTNNEVYDMGKTYSDTKTTADGTYYNSGIIVGSNWLTNNFKPTGTTTPVNHLATLSH
jgi:parallel beta-helix repeat protein